MVKIGGLQKISVIDYPGKLVCTVFLSGCNYECPTCHAKHIIYGKNKIPEEDFFNYLDSRKGLIDAIVICGGEPTFQHDLADFARKIKERGLAVKLDTNGSDYSLLADLIKKELVDYIALDIKGPPPLYKRLVEKDIDLRDDIEKAIGIIQYAPDYEFRTTIVPLYRGENISFMTPEEAEEMAEWVDKFVFVNPKEIKWYIQRFVARSKDEMMDENFSEENLQKELRETPEELLKEIEKKIKDYFPNCKIR